MKRRILVSLITAVLAFGAFALPMYAGTTADVTITATPTFLSITNSEATWTLGAIAENTAYYWTADGLVAAEPLVDGDMKATITNAGSVTCDVDIKCADFTGGVGWTLSADETPGANEINLRAGITGMANRAAMVQVTNSDIELIDSIAAAGTKMWCMEMESGTFTDGAGKTGVVTLTISVHV